MKFQRGPEAPAGSPALGAIPMLNSKKEKKMLTAKWCYEADGISRERVFETDAVSIAYDNRGSLPAGCPVSQTAAQLGIYYVPPGGIVVIGNPHEGADSMAFAHGKVFVMNRDG